jgi:flagellar L-ring protein precursor FlgH
MRVETTKTLWRVVVAAGLCCATVAPAAAQNGNYEETYNRYLAAARRSDSGRASWMTDLTSDQRARYVNDLITIRVVESLTAVGAAEANVGESGSAAAVYPGRIGSELNHLLPFSTSSKFNGAGGTSRTTELFATLTARVTEVLPSGDLVVEGVREVDINGDRNVVVLTGVVRIADIRQGNVILSSQVGQLRIQSVSEGLIRDSLTPGWIIKVFNKIF